MMIRMIKGPGAQRPGDDDGVALIVAISLVGLVAILVLTLVAVALAEARASGRDRQRSGAVMTAEGRVDTLMAQIQSASPATLPCGVLTGGDTTVVSDLHDVTATVTYYDAAGAPVDCALLSTTPVVQASVSATSESDPIVGTSPAKRTVETLLQLTPTYDNDLDKAIFGDGGISVANHAEIFGQDGQPNADIYTNGSMQCENNQHYYGSIFAQGTVSMSNRCVIEVDVHARDGVSATNNQVAVNGKILVSNGSINLGPAHLGQEARASGTVTGNVCSATPAKCVGGVVVAAPPHQDFPQYLWADATTQWDALGYDTVLSFPQGPFTCGNYTGPALNGRNLNGKVDGVGAWLITYASTLTDDTLILVDCPGQPVMSQGNFPIELGANVVLYSKGGVSFRNQTSILSSGGDRYLYLIQPYDAVSIHPCTSIDGIALDNQVTVAPEVDVMLYSPCNIRKANNTTHYGQIYSGGIAKIDNALTMYYNPLPMPASSAASSTVSSYSVEVVYKRENR